jgi:thymidylate kinase
MMTNKVSQLFNSFNDEKVSYCVRSRFTHLPDKLDGGDVDLLIAKHSWKKAKCIIEEKGFQHYPHTEPNVFYYIYDRDLGLIQLDILVKDLVPSTMRYKSFFIPKDKKKIRNNKKFLWRIWTGIVRRSYYIMKGRVICFDGPDGSGKSTLAQEVNGSMKKFPIRRKIIHFGAGKINCSKLERAASLLYKIFLTNFNKAIGRITLADRYIYLTFRKNHPLLRKIVQLITPKPDCVFILKADYSTLVNRKKGQRDLLDKELVSELYKVFEKVPNKRILKAENSVEENVAIVANEILEITLNSRKK